MSDDERSGTRRSSRSRVKASKNQDALEKLKELRKTGRSNRIDVNEYTPDLYEEVDEEEYAEKFGGDDFVVDDDGSGYVDNGRDDEEDSHYIENEKDKKKKDRRAGKVKKGALDNYFSAVVPHKKETEQVVTKDISEDLAALLAEIDSEGPGIADELSGSYKRTRTPISFSPQRTRAFSPDSFSPPAKRTRAISPVSFSPPSNHAFNFSPPSKQTRAVSPAVQQPRAISPETHASPLKQIREASPESFSPPETDAFSSQSFSFPTQIPESFSCPTELPESLSPATELPDSQSLQFFWIDAYEDPKIQKGKVYLFGFVKSESSDEFESCCLIIDKILHRTYFVARETHRDTGEAVTSHMLYQEITALLLNDYKILEFKSKDTTKKFAFMDDVTPDEALCMEVCYDPKYPPMPPGPFNGKCISRIANATVTAMERLLIERGIKGPCWLEIEGAEEESGSKVSYCKREFKVSVSTEILPKVELDLVNKITIMDSQPMPKCKMMALNIITVANPKTNKSEIVLISMLKSARYFLDRQGPENWEQRKTFVCAPPGATLPLQFQHDAEKAKINAEKCLNEKSMLQRFLGAIKMFDPDVVIGHDLASQMSILRERLENNKLIKTSWTFMGRLNRDAKLNGEQHTKEFQTKWTAGRLYLDSKAATTELKNYQSYDLGELVSKVLNKPGERPDINSEKIARIFYEHNGKTDLIFKLINWSVSDAQYSYRILSKQNAMQTFLQITKIVGGVLSRTLSGGRSERNEFLLLHAFFEKGYIAPDKITHNQKDSNAVTQKKTTQKSEGTETAPQPSKKAQYTGGLVLEPKKGLYETYIVLLDFNSLYPSIIQEFNICFTTVKLNQGEEADESDLPSIPDSSLPPGILSLEIGNLVRCRQEVKKEMKRVNDKDSPQYKQCDIRQLAFKLTANSMYGCLGFEGSRFCAKTLAAMITAKGREILESTRNIVENNGFTVIYGDTDSIMVNTNSLKLDEARKIGKDIKELINKSYKQLTLDVDGIYKKLLLLKKKKYAGLAVDLSDEKKVSMELKGLDIVRRDWSFVAKEVGEKVVDIILTSTGRDEMVEEIRRTLASVKEGIEQQQIPLEKFEILKKLTHNPQDYRDAKSQPHVLVALRLNQTKNANLRKDDIVKYIICDDGSGQAATQRAYARIEIENKTSELKIDMNYYLAHQIHPIVSRLCEPIEEMDACQVAVALGLDGTHYRRKLIEQADDDVDENCPPGILFNFNACEGLSIKCPKCSTITLHRSPVTEDRKPALAECPSCKYDFLGDPITIELQIIKFLHSAFEKYTQSKYVCDDRDACGFELSMSPIFKTPFGYPCFKCSHGFFKRDYTLKKLYDQQNFISQIVDFKEWQTKEASKEQLDALKGYPRITVYGNVATEWSKRVKKIIEENPYNRVDLSAVFGPMKIV